MSRSQIVLVVIGVISVIFLFSLPKIIVENKKQLEDKTQGNNLPEKSSNETVHTASVSENDLKNLTELRKQYLNFSDKEKKLKFADSLGGYFRRLHLYDSVLVYREAEVALKRSPETLTKAADAYMEAYSIAPDQNNGYQKKAREYYDQALKLQPDNLEIKSRLAMTYVGGEETMKAVGMLREVLEKDPANESAIYNLGILAIQSGQYDKAVKRFTDLVKVNPENGPGTFYLGLSYMQLGDKEKAKEYFKKAKKLDNDPGFQATVDSYLEELK